MRAVPRFFSILTPVIFVFFIFGIFAPIQLPFEQSRPEAKAVASWYNVSWPYRKAITVTSSASIVPSSQSNFPMLVSTTDSNLTSFASSTGADILFTSSDGTTKLSHEVESYTSSTGNLLAWVNVPTLATSTVLYMYYGNTAAAAQQSVTSTWSNGFVMVQHMVAAPAQDSTVYGINASSTAGGSTVSTTGQIGSAAAFVSASTQFQDYGTTSTLNPAVMTFSAWIKGVSFPNAYNAVVARDSATPNGDYSFFITSAGKIAVYVRDLNSNDISYDGTGDISSGTPLTTGAWYYVTFTYDTTGTPTMVSYLNAAVDKTLSNAGWWPLNRADVIKNGRLGEDPTYSGRAWNGLIDEARVSNVARTANWLTTEYKNQSNPGTFYTTGSQEAFDAGYYFTVTGTATQTAGTSQVATITMKDANNSDATVTTYTGLHNLVFSGPAVADSGTVPTASGITIGATTTLTFTSGVATTSLILYKVETASLDVLDATTTAYTSATSTTYDLDIVVGPGTFSAIAFDDTITTATSGVAFSFQTRVNDTWKNAATSTIVTTTVAVSTGTISPSSIPASAYYVNGTSTTSTVISGITEVQSVILTITNGAISVTTSISVTGTPRTPTGVSVIRVSDTSFTVGWTDTSTIETGYLVERSVDSGSGFGAYATVTTTAANATSTSDTGTVANRKYQWRVSGVNSVGTSTSATDSLTHYTTPSALTTATSTRVSDTSFTITFTTSSPTTNTTTIDRCADSACDTNTFTNITSTTAATYSDTTTAANKRYKWRVAAASGAPENVTSTYTTTTFEYTTPSAPTSLSATYVSDSSISLVWTDNSAYEDGFSIDVSTDGGGYSMISTTTVSAGVTTYSYTGSSANHIYQFRARAHVPTTTVAVADLFSTFTTSSIVTTTPSAPTSAAATFVSDSRIDLSWTDNSTYETGFGVERDVDTGSGLSGIFTQIATSSANATSYSDTSTAAERRYQYRVRALSANANSTYSTTTIVTTTPTAPSGIAVSRTSDTSFVVSWTDNSFVETGYAVERAVDGSSSYTSFVTTTASATSTTDTGTTANHTYTWRVRAVGVNGNSAYNTSTIHYTTPSAPTTATSTRVSDTSFTVTFTTSSATTNTTTIDRCADSACDTNTFTNITSTTAATYSDTTTAANKRYKWRVAAASGAPENVTSTYTTTTFEYTTPSAPTSLTATYVSDSSISLGWTDNSAYEDLFALEVSTDGGAYASFASSSANATTTSYSSGSTNHIYQFRTRAHVPTTTANATDLYSTYVTSTIVTTTPSAPSGVSATSTATSSMTFAWTDNATFEASYLITFVTGTHSAVTGIAANATSTSVTDLSANTQYAVTISAVSAGGANTSTASTAVYTLAATPSAPSIGTAAQTSLPITINGNGNPTTTAFAIFNSTDNVYLAASGASNGATPIWQTTSTWGSSFSATGLTCNTTYSFLVKARNGDGVTTAASSLASSATSVCPVPPQAATVPPPAPSLLGALSSPTEVYFVTINNGVADTTSTFVTLTLSAPPGTVSMIISNLEDFRGALSEGYVPTKPWQLLPGNGPKKVYVTFFTTAGVQSGVKTASINLQPPPSTTTPLLLPVIIPPVVAATNTTTPISSSTFSTSTPPSDPFLDPFSTESPTPVVLVRTPQPVLFTAILQRGDNNKAVYRLQVFLNQQGFVVAKQGPGSPGQETNNFGSATRQALQRFQRAHQLPATGSLDLATRTVINALLTQTAVSAIQAVGGVKVLSVKAAQQILNRLGYPVAKRGPGSPGKETNILGTATRAALLKFQQAKKLPRTGKLDSKTQAALGNE